VIDPFPIEKLPSMVQNRKLGIMLVGITTYFIIFHAAPLFFFVVYTASIAGGAALSYNQSQK
jgi:hypothetical protein